MASRGSAESQGHVVAWVIHRLRGGRAHAPLNVAAPDASHHFTVSVLYCPDACPAEGDHAHFICLCVTSVRLPVYVHLDGIVSPRMLWTSLSLRMSFIVTMRILLEFLYILIS